MHIVIAEAALGEAAELFGMLIIGGAILIGAGLLACSRWKRSLVAIGIVCFLVFMSGLLLEPWTVISLAPSDDPDTAYWLAWRRFVSVMWVLLALAAAVRLSRVIRYERSRQNVQNAA